MDGWLQRVRKSEEYSDVVVRVNGEDFHLHMLPLRNASAYFRSLPSSGSDGTVCQPQQAHNCKLLVTIPDLPGGVEGFATCVDMCYLLDPVLTELNVAHVCAAAEFLAMEEVVETTKQFMHTSLFSHWRSCVNFLHNYTRLGSPVDDYVESECRAVIESACVKSFTETKHLSAPSSYRVSGPHRASGLTELVVQVCGLPDVYVGEIVDSLVATDVNLNLKCRQGRNVRRWLENVECCSENARGWMLLWLSRMLVKNVPAKRPWMELSSQYWCSLLEQVGLLVPLLDHPLKAKLTEVKATLEEKIGQSLDEMDEYLRDYKFSATTLLSLVENFTTTRQLQESCPLESLQEIANDVDQFLWFYAEENSISTDTFLKLVRAFPPCARASHDTVYGAMEKLLSRGGTRKIFKTTPPDELQSLMEHSHESASNQLRTVLHQHSQEFVDDVIDDIDHSQYSAGSQSLRTVLHRHRQELANDVTNDSQLRTVLHRHRQLELADDDVTDGIDHLQYSAGSQSLRTVLHRHSQELADDVTDGRHLKHIMQKVIDASLNLLEENSQRSREIVALQKQYGALIDCRAKRLDVVEDFLRRKHSISSETEGSEISDTTTVSSSITVLGYNPGMHALRDILRDDPPDCSTASSC